MNIVNPSVEIMRTGLEKEPVTPEQFIEKVGRTCYKSEDKITDNSAAKFVGGLVKRGHEAMIEHWSLIFKTTADWYEDIRNDWIILMNNGNEPNREALRPFIRFTDWQDPETKECRCIISGNMRAWRDYAKACMDTFSFLPGYMETIIRNYSLFFPEFQDHVAVPVVNNVLIPITASDLVGDFEKGIHQDITVKFTCDRGVSHEIVRHRTASFAQESTRYCNYGGDKFGNEITVVRPSWCERGSDIYNVWRDGCIQSENAYFTMLSEGATPQEARSVLVNSLKTEVIMTGNLNCWNHFFMLRCAPDAQPDMREVANMAKAMFNIELNGATVEDIIPETPFIELDEHQYSGLLEE